MAIYESPSISPEGYTEVELLPQQTGLRGPRYLYVQKEVVERDIDPETGTDRSLPRIKRNIYDNRTRMYPLFQPRTKAEANNTIELINKERAKEDKKPITMAQYDYITNQLANSLQAQEAVAEEMKRREDPYKYYLKKFKDGYDATSHREAIGNTASIFQLFRDPRKFARDKYTALNNMVREVVPGSRNDFVTIGDVAGTAVGFKGARPPGAPKVVKSLGDEILEGAVFKTTAGATLGGTAMSLVYDLVNAGIRKTTGIPDPQDAPNAALEALVHGRNTLYFTGGAAGLSGVASTLRPFLGKVLFGLDGPTKQLANFAQIYDAPIGISTVTGGAGGKLSGALGPAYFRIVGKLPLLGAGFQERNTLASIRLTKGMQQQVGELGSGMSDDPIIEFMTQQYKALPKATRQSMDKAAVDQGFKSYKELLDAELRLNELAPIQHMTDVGAFMFDSAGKRYKQFSYINNLLYDDFENKAKKISKDFIPTEKTKYIANQVRDQLADAKIKLTNYEEFRPQFDAIDDFVVNTLANLPKYIKPKDVRTLQREINRLYQEAESQIGPAFAKKQGTAGGSQLAAIRKALITDLNDYANWAPGLNAEEKIMAESAKKSLFRANEVFAKMSPLYKSPAAKQFNLVDQNLFTQGPDLPGYFYSDEIGKMLFRSGLTPQRVRDYEQLVGKQAFMAGVRSWINNGFKAALKDSPDITFEIARKDGSDGTMKITEKALNIDKFKQNINLEDEGFQTMMDLAGYNGKAFMDNMKQLVKLQEMVKTMGIGTSTSQIIARRLSLGGVRSAAASFSLYGGSAAGGFLLGGPAGAAAPIMLGLLTRKTSKFLSTPDSLKAYTNIIDPKASSTVKRSSLVNFLRSYFRDDEIREELPKDFNTPQKVLNDPEGFLDYLYDSEYLGVTDSVNDGFLKEYMIERYGDNNTLTFGESANIRDEEAAFNDIQSGKAKVIEGNDIVMPEVPNMGGESVIGDQASLSGPGMAQPLNQDQRAALASGDIDAALALRGRM